MTKNVPYELGIEFNQAIEEIRRTSMGTPKKLTLDLSVAQTNPLEMNITGNFFYILHSADTSNNIDIRFNESREPDFQLFRKMGFFTPYYRLFLTWDAQVGGTMVIVYGTLARPFLDILDNRSDTLDDLASMLEQLEGDTAAEGYGRVAIGAAATLIIAANNNRKSIGIQHMPTGVGRLYLGYDNTVTTIKYFITLEPGGWWSTDDYRGTIYGFRSAGATNAQYGEQ